MASAKLAPILSDLIGSVGQDTFSHTRAVLICKERSHPGSKNPFTPSPSQLTIQGLFKLGAVNWKLLDLSAIDDWCKLAGELKKSNKFNESYAQAGFNLYCELMLNIQLIGGSIYNSTPTVPTIVPLSSFTITLYGDPLDRFILSFSGLTTATGISHLIYSTPPVSSGRFYVKSMYRKIGFIPHDTTDYYDIISLYKTFFPLPLSGQKIFVKLIPLDNSTGFTATPIIVSAVYNH